MVALINLLFVIFILITRGALARYQRLNDGDTHADGEAHAKNQQGNTDNIAEHPDHPRQTIVLIIMRLLPSSSTLAVRSAIR